MNMARLPKEWTLENRLTGLQMTEVPRVQFSTAQGLTAAPRSGSRAHRDGPRSSAAQRGSGRACRGDCTRRNHGDSRRKGGRDSQFGGFAPSEAGAKETDFLVDIILLMGRV